MQNINDDYSNTEDWETFQHESDEIRNIILSYKTKQCLSNCQLDSCEYYHNPKEKRRKPFDNNGRLNYIPSICNNSSNCLDDHCKYSHNDHEINYHPKIFRTVSCTVRSNIINKTVKCFINNFTMEPNPNPDEREKKISIFSNISSKLTGDITNNTNLVESARRSYYSEVGPKNLESENFMVNKKKLSLTETRKESVFSFNQNENENESTPSFKIADESIKEEERRISELILSDCPHNQKFCAFYHSETEKRSFFKTPKESISNENKDKKSKKKLLTIENLANFKTKKCENQLKHSEKQCYDYHSTKDKRRPLYHFYYGYNLCSNIDKVCPKGDKCNKSHNQVEMFYHREKFKTKFCSYFSNSKTLNEINLECPYGLLCSFAHSEIELVIELLHQKEKNDLFFINSFKTVLCPFDKFHDKSFCVYSHNFQDYRRNPNKFKYEKKNCSNWDNKKTIIEYIEGCKNGFNCSKSHGWKEHDYHPLVYKTIKCKKYFNCDKGFFCPFYHCNETKRIIHEDEINEYGNQAPSEKQEKKLIFNYSKNNTSLMQNDQGFQNKLNISSNSFNNLNSYQYQNFNRNFTNSYSNCNQHLSFQDNRNFYNNYDSNNVNKDNQINRSFNMYLDK